MPASPPGTVTMSAPASDGSTANATLSYDPDTLALADPTVTTSGDTQLELVFTLASDGVTTYTWTIPPGSSIAAADLASVGLSTWDQIGNVSLAAA